MLSHLKHHDRVRGVRPSDREALESAVWLFFCSFIQSRLLIRSPCLKRHQAALLHACLQLALVCVDGRMGSACSSYSDRREHNTKRTQGRQQRGALRAMPADTWTVLHSGVNTNTLGRWAVEVKNV